MSISDYLIDQKGIEWSEILRDWSWTLPREFTIWLVSRFGDLIVVLGDGTVHLLDVGGGTFEKLAESRDDFADKIDDDDNANNWLMIRLVDKLVAAGITLHDGQCYSFRVPPILGGKYSVDNAIVLSVRDHFSAYGSIQEQLKDVPDGTAITIKSTRQ